MASVTLSPEQLAAIHAPGNVLVRAGAGSGKTEVLARRFVAHIAGDIAGCPPVEPSRIAAITFTEKATDDMRRRIREVLDKMSLAAGHNTSRRDRLRRARRTLSAARITTIHGFCARLLRENPLQAGVDPDFEVLDEFESAAWLERNCAELLIDAIHRHDAGARRLVTARSFRGTGGFRAGAVSMVTELVSEMARTGADPQWLRAATQSTAATVLENSESVAAAAKQLADSIEWLLANVSAAAVEPLREAWPQFKGILASFNSASPPSILAQLAELLALLPSARTKAIKPYLEQINELLSAASNDIGLTGKLIEAYGTSRAALAMRDVAETVADIAEKIAQRAIADRVVTFDGLLTAARSLLLQDEVAARYRSALSALLVDEYQDTDPVQDEIVRLLTEPREGLAAPSLFIVGDEKQSIYRFRGADVSVFNRPRETEVTQCALVENRRSVPAILDFVNVLSAHVMRANSRMPFWITWREEHRLRALRPQIADVSVEILLLPPENENSRPLAHQVRRREAAAVANWTAAALRSALEVLDPRTAAMQAARYGDIAILLRSFNDVQIYEQALDAAAIPYYTVKGRGFFGSTEIIDIASLLAAIDDPDDGLALAAALRSPLFGLSDQCLLELAVANGTENPSLPRFFKQDDLPDFAVLGAESGAARHAWNLIRELRSERTNLPIAALVELALERTRFETVMAAQRQGDQRVANIRKLVAIARRFDESGQFLLTDFVRYLQQVADDEPREPQAQLVAEGEDVVRLMTIHQAKGLEFPVVILPDLGRRMPNSTRQYAISQAHGLLLRDSVGSGYHELPNRLLADFCREEAEKDYAEMARLLYVAVTRARDRLVLCPSLIGNGGTWAKQIRTLIGEDVISDFLCKSEESRLLNLDDATVLLRRACVETLSPPIKPAERAPDPTETARIPELVASRLTDSTEQMMEITASPTELADFHRCPRQYLLRHMLGTSEGIVAASSSGSAVEMGLVAHAVLDELSASAGGSVTSDAVADAVARHSAGTRLLEAHRAEITADLVRYFHWQADQARARDESIIGREVPFFLRISRKDVTLYVRGRVDLIAATSARILVRDYKYSSRVMADESAYQVQMEAYALAAGSQYPADNVGSELVFLRGSIRVLPIQLPEPRESERRLTDLARRLFEARRNGTFPRGPSSAEICRNLGCGYIARCWKG
jgi:ATP-dependent helicase/nuclease subunit A